MGLAFSVELRTHSPHWIKLYPAWIINERACEIERVRFPFIDWFPLAVNRCRRWRRTSRAPSTSPSGSPTRTVSGEPGYRTPISPLTRRLWKGVFNCKSKVSLVIEVSRIHVSLLFPWMNFNNSLIDGCKCLIIIWINCSPVTLPEPYQKSESAPQPYFVPMILPVQGGKVLYFIVIVTIVVIIVFIVMSKMGYAILRAHDPALSRAERYCNWNVPVFFWPGLRWLGMWWEQEKCQKRSLSAIVMPIRGCKLNFFSDCWHLPSRGCSSSMQDASREGEW